MTISGVRFDTKGEAVAFAKSIRKRYLELLGVEFSPADHMFILDYTMQTHPEAERVIGIGVAKMYMAIDPTNFKHGVNGADGHVLIFEQHNGEKNRVNLRAQARSYRQDVMNAMRNAAGHPPRSNACDWCDTTEGPFHSHHDPTLAELVKHFLESKETELSGVRVDRSPVIPRLADQAFAADWIWFHSQHAGFETLCVKCHYQDGHGWDVSFSN